MFDEKVLQAAKGHAISSFPSEACGLVVNGCYIPCANKAEDPTKTFAIDVRELLLLTKEHPLQAIIHSHPHSSVTASSTPRASDMTEWLASGVT